MTSDGDRWEMLGSELTTARYMCAAACTENNVYVVGGKDNSGAQLSSVERMGLGGKKKNWVSAPAMISRRYGCAAVAIQNKLYVFGGYDGRNVLSSAEIYDEGSGRWSSLPPMKTPRYGCAAAHAKEKIYVVGGYDGETYLSTAECFDLAANRWEAMPEMTSKRDGCAAVAVSNNLLVFGGYDGSGNRLASAEVYDFGSRRWSSLPPMEERRRGCAAVAVGDVIYVLGGYDGEKELSSVERFSLATRTWSRAGCMNVARWYCAAVVSPTNEIYVIGGEDNTNTKLSSTEVLRLPTEASPFYQLLLEEDNRNINLKIADLIPLTTDVHQAKFLYTLINSCYRLGYLDIEDRVQYVRSALNKAATTTTCTSAAAVFKLILRKAEEDGVIDSLTKEMMDREAEVTNAAYSPFLRDLWQHIEANRMSIRCLEARVDGLEERMGRMEAQAQRLESCYESLHGSLEKLLKGISRHRKMDAAVGMMGAVLSAVSFGIAGSALSGAMNLAIGSIVDFGDLAHIQTVVKSIGDKTVEDALEKSLMVVEGMATGMLYSDAKEASQILNATVHSQLIAAGKDGNPIAAISVTAHIIGSMGTSGAVDSPPGPGKKIPPAQKKLSVLDCLKHLEGELGLDNTSGSVLKRLEKMEMTVFGQVGTGSVGDRVKTLENELGVATK